MDKSLKIALVLSAVDKMSRVVDAAVNKSLTKLENFQKKADKISESAFSFGRDAGAVGLAIGAPIAYATKQFIDFEDKMADVAKVTNTAIGSAQFEKLSQEAKDLGVYLGKSGEEAAGLYASLAQGGVPQAELFKVGKMAGEVAVAFDMMPEAAGDAFIKTKNAMGGTVEQTKKVFDAINALSDNDAAKASQIVTFMANGGAGVSNTLKMAGQDVAAFGTTMVAMGKSGEEAATIMKRFQKAVMENAGYNKIYNQADGGAAGLMAILEKGASLQGKEQYAFFADIGEYGQDVMQMAQNLGQLQKNLKLTGDASKYAGSAKKEYDNRQSTTKGQINKQLAELSAIMLDVGQAMIPVLTDVLKAVAPMIKSFAQWVKQNPELTATLVKLAAGAAAVSFAASGLSFAYGGVTKAMSIFSNVGLSKPLQVFKALKFGAWALKYHFVTGLIPAITKGMIAFKAFGLALLANPITWYVAGAVALGAAAYLIYKNWDKISAFFKNVFDKVKGPFTEVLNFVFGFGDNFYKAGESIPKMIFRGMLSAATLPIRAIAAITKKVRAYLPFSPAKEGAFRDLHRVKIVETIAQSMKPKPLVSAMSEVTEAAANAAGGTGSLRGGGGVGGGHTTLHFSPTINVTGGGGNVQEQVTQASYELKKQFEQWYREMQRNQSRVSFG